MHVTQEGEIMSNTEKHKKNELSGSYFSKSICSVNDCTGLIPALPTSEAELEAYEEMYQFCLTNASGHPASDTDHSKSDTLS